jgi:hypothetical protein
LNIVWAMRIVAKPVARPIVMKRPSSAAPRTTSGVASGRKTKKSVNARPLKRWRTSASAMNVPSTTASAVDSAAISSEFVSASCRPSTANGLLQWSSVKPSHVRLYRPCGSLNENATTTAIGANR